jgi:hypothetical protein
MVGVPPVHPVRVGVYEVHADLVIDDAGMVPPPAALLWSWVALVNDAIVGVVNVLFVNV